MINFRTTWENSMETTQWKILFCQECLEPTPPISGMMTDHRGFICDECLNTELEGNNDELAPITGFQTY